MSFIALASTLITLLLCAWWLHDEPCRLIRSTEIDIGSGDLRDRLDVQWGTIATLPVRRVIRESPLSREARRLGISQHGARLWRLAFVKHATDEPHVDYGYAYVVEVSGQLAKFLRETNTPDNERRAIIEKYLTAMRTADSVGAQECGYVLMLEIADKHGLHIGSPEFEDQIRRSEF